MRKLRLAGALAGLILLSLSVAVWSQPAGAHALLAESKPADGATVEEPPSEVLLTFTEAVDPLLTVVHVLDSSGSRFELGKTEVPGIPTRARVGVAPLPKGVYTVTWRTTSTADGHTTVGSVAFGVGVAAEAVGAEATTNGVRSPTGVSIAGRWLFYAGAVLLLGAAVVAVLVVATPANLSVWALNASWAAMALGLALTIADQRATTRTSLATLLDSSTGHKLKAQAVAVAVTWLGVCWASLRPRRWSWAAVGVGASAVMLERALSGHADATTAPWFTVSAQWLHMVSVGAWVGGLAWMLIAMRRRDPGQGKGLARRFSTIAAATLGVVFLTGAVRAFDEVGAWRRLVDTSFGVTLLIKLGLFAALVAVGARSRFRHVPAAVAARVGGLRRSVKLEIAIGAAVLVAAAVLTGLPPSASVAEAKKLQRTGSLTVAGSDFATSVRVRLLVSPGVPGPNRFDATVVDYDQRTPVKADSVTLRFRHNERADLVAPDLPLSKDPDAHWRGSSSALSLDGRWTVTVVVQTPTDAVEVPLEVTTARRPAPAPAAAPPS